MKAEVIKNVLRQYIQFFHICISIHLQTIKVIEVIF